MKYRIYMLCALPMCVSAGGGESVVIESNYDDTFIAYEMVEVEVVPKRIKVKNKVAKKKETLELSVTPSSVETQKKYYIGLSFSNMDIDAETSTLIMKNAKPLAVTATLGYDLLDNVALEGRIGTGGKRDMINILATSRIDKSVGVYVKPNVNLVENIRGYALLGYGKSKHTINSNMLSTEGFSYGVGLGYKLSDTWTLVSDALRYAKESKESVDAYSIGLNYQF